MTLPLVLAFYLPQFHPVPENDAWWGPGFTEWTNVARARPLWDGHYQPHLPGELGFYDLRVPEVREQQAHLARSHGINGFCYYHYWFGGGRRVIERPFTEVLRSGSPDFPFCLAWANENWTRGWDAGERSVLMPQQYSPEDDEAHGRYLIETFGDPRYIKVDGRPLLLIYRVQELPNPRETFERWRTMARAAGFPDLYIVRFETHGDFQDPAAFGCDASAEFLPHGVFEVIPPTQLPDCTPGNLVYSYDDIARHFASRDPATWVRHPCVFPSWDNTPRHSDGSVIAVNGTSVDTYEWWLQRALERAEHESPEQRIVFLNAWNEWAEGAHLEPDQRNGRRYLEATLAAITARGGEPTPSTPAPVPSAASAEGRYRDLYAKYVALQREHTAFLGTMERRLSLAVDPIERELHQARHDGARLAAKLAEVSRPTNGAQRAPQIPRPNLGPADTAPISRSDTTVDRPRHWLARRADGPAGRFSRGTWLDAKHLEIEGQRFFVTAEEHEYRQTESVAEQFVLLKSPSILELLFDVLPATTANVVDLGIFKGGSVVLYETLLNPNRLVAIDLCAPRVAALDRYIEDRSLGDVISLHYGVDQADQDALRAILDDEFGSEPLDLVVDDCSHLYAPTKAALNVLLPRLRPGAFYAIEDWGWAHWQGDEWQGPQPHFASDEPALSNLVLELIVLAASRPDVVSDVRVTRDLVLVTRGDAELDGTDFDVSAAYLTRGRRFPLTL